MHVRHLLGRSPATLASATVLAAGVVVGGFAVASPAPAATPPTTSFVTMVGQNDYISQNQSLLFDTADGASVTVSGNTGEIDVSANAGSNGFGFDLAAPPGDDLAVGSYTGAQRTPFRSTGSPGIDISGEGRGCNTDVGAFTVEDIAFAGGQVSRLRLDYLQRCEGGTGTLTGEIAINEPVSGNMIAPAVGAFPKTYPGASSPVQPIYVLAPADASLRITSASLTGADPGQFAIRSDTCSGTTLDAGDVCAVYLRFSPTVAGPASATLHIVTGSGSSDVPLSGFGSHGLTEFSYTSDSGDYIGQGGAASYTPAADTVSASGSTNLVRMDVTGADGSNWDAEVTPGKDDILAAGSTYTNATRYPFNGDGPGLSVTGDSRGCNTVTGSFTVNQASFDVTSGTLKSIDLTYEQHCEGETPALRGRIAFQSLTKGETSDDVSDPYPTTDTPNDAQTHPAPLTPTATPTPAASPTASPTAPSSSAPTASPVAPPATVGSGTPQGSPGVGAAPAVVPVVVMQPTVTPALTAPNGRPVTAPKPRQAIRLPSLVTTAVRVRGSSTVSVKVRSAGAVGLMLSKLAISGRSRAEWKILGGCPRSLAVGRTCTLRLLFHPAHTGAAVDTLVLSTGLGLKRVTLVGQAY